MILGIDTSCYTTSAALVDEAGCLLAEKRLLLPVEQGEKGLRQSEGLFLHTKQLPDMVEAVFGEAKQMARDLKAVAVSVRPRPVKGSYMPVFLAGTAVARSIAAAVGCEVFPFSHQEGHLEAALASAKKSWQAPFLALHLSGGTGELLYVKPLELGYEIEVVGHSDLPPGQFIDRVGVALGLPFPAGPYLEKLAGDAAGDFRLSGSVKGMEISFSGPESAAQRGIAAGVPHWEIAAAVLDNVGKSLEKAILCGMDQYHCRHCIAAGGVAANQRIRRRLEKIGVTFADPKFAGDNAFGIARLGAKAYSKQNK